MKKKEIETISSSKICFGNLFLVQEGVARISKIRYGVIEQKKYFFQQPSYIAYPGEFKVLVGTYEITKNDEGIPFLINVHELKDEIGEQEITGHQFFEWIQKENSSHSSQKILKIN